MTDPVTGWALRRGGGIAQVPGVRTGQWTGAGPDVLSGVTIIAPPPGTVAGVDVRGGGPAVHETEILAPGTLGHGADAIVLTGGSAYGLAAARGVQDVLARADAGTRVPGGLTVPIVPAAAIFDLGRGTTGAVTAPGPREGALAAEAALAFRPADPAARGSVGAGVGAWSAGGLVRGGVGQAAIDLGGITVAALAVVNCHGRVLDATGRLFAAPVLAGYGITPPAVPSSVLEELDADRERRDPLGLGASPRNTTIACIVTNARLDPAETTRLAATAHAGLARAVYPSHTLFDGDTVFALATGSAADSPIRKSDTAQATAEAGTSSAADGSAADAAERSQLLTDLGQAAADALSAAIVDGVLSATDYPHGGRPTTASPPPLCAAAPELAAYWTALP